MGLLRKAARAVPAHQTNAPAAGEPGQRKSEAGLLSKSLRLLESGPLIAALPERRGSGRAPVLDRAARTLPLRAPDMARQILEDTKALSDGVELPSRLFTLLRKRLSITRGALLLYDPVRLEYAPWASHGFDQTTLHRMRIPLGANETFNALANGESIEVTQAARRTEFQRFFSSREFSTLERIVLSPFIVDEILVGVLLAAEIRYPFASSAELLWCLSRVSSGAAPLLQNARGFLARWSQARLGRPPVAPVEQVIRLLASPAARGKTFLLLGIPLDAYVRGIAATHEDIDQFRLREDIRVFLDAFLADLGVAVTLPAGVLLVCLQGIGRDDIDLFLHQLRDFLGQHFFGKPMDIQAVKSRIWPDDGTNVQELIAFFSS